MHLQSNLSGDGDGVESVVQNITHNKENIPPVDFVNQFHLPNIVPEFNTHFKTYTQYHNYWNWHLGSWLSDTNFAMFDRAYCHHRLILQQKDGLQNMWKLIDDQLAELNIQDQMNNIKLLLPSLWEKGHAVHITNTLGRPDVVGEPSFSYPLSTWTLPNQDYPVTPTPPPNPFIPESKKKQNVTFCTTDSTLSPSLLETLRRHIVDHHHYQSYAPFACLDNSHTYYMQKRGLYTAPHIPIRLDQTFIWLEHQQFFKSESDQVWSDSEVSPINYS